MLSYLGGPLQAKPISHSKMEQAKQNKNSHIAKVDSSFSYYGSLVMEQKLEAEKKAMLPRHKRSSS